MPELLNRYLQQKLEQRQQLGNKRVLRKQLQGIDFLSNDYLGIATTGVLHEAMRELGEDLSYGSTGSRLLSGNFPLAEEVESALAAFHQAEAALLFNSGYDANLGLFSALAGRHSTVLYDELCHASILDGIRLSQAKNKFQFAHNNTGQLEALLHRHAASGPVLVAVESLYSMDGDTAPLQEMAELAAQYQAALVVDEAHATGVFGARGEGLVQQLGLQNRVFARVHTCGKALGCHGALVVGPALLKEYLVNFARSFIFSTAMPPKAVLAIQQAYQWMSDNAAARTQLHALIGSFNSLKKNTGSAYWLPGDSPVQSLVTGSNHTCRALAQYLNEQGFRVAAIMHPTVPKGKERIRICLHTFNTESQIGLLHQHIQTYLCQQP